jgi:rubrerythrin
MKFAVEELFEIAKKVYRKHGVDMTIEVKEGVGIWAANSENEDYCGGEADVIDEIEGYDYRCPDCGEPVKIRDVIDGQCPECKATERYAKYRK